MRKNVSFVGLAIIASNALYVLHYLAPKAFGATSIGHPLDYGCKTALSSCTIQSLAVTGVCEDLRNSSGSIYCACVISGGSSGTTACQGSDN